MKIPILLLLSLSFLHANDFIGGGRTQSQGVYLEFYAGYGDMSSLEGRVQETSGGAIVSGGLDTSLVDLNISDGSDVISFGGSLTGKWFTLLANYHQSSVDASGTATSEIRLNVDDVNFNSQQLDYLLIPVGSKYSVSADTNILALGLRFTPFTINPKGNLRFTPWLHLGAQYIVSDFNIDSGNTISLDIAGFDNRVYAVNGNASGEAQLIVPEYGFGGEFRYFLGDNKTPGAELVGYATYTILEYNGALDDLGVDADSFDELDTSYSMLELGANLYLPIGDSVDLLLGIYYEQVDSTSTLFAKPSAGSYQREVELNYAMYGLRAGLRF